VATTVRMLNDHSREMNRLHDLIEAEQKGFPQERRDAGDNQDLLDGISRREADLRVAAKLYREAADTWKLAAAARDTNPDDVDRHYAECVRLTAEVRAIVDYRTKAKAADTSEPKGDDGDGSDAADGKAKKGEPVPSPDTTTDPAEGEAEEEGEGTDEPEEKAGDDADPIMAAIAKLGADCAQRHDETTNAIEALKAGLLKPELAALLNTLDEDTLRAILNRRELTPLGTELIEVLAAYSPEELKTMLANLAAASGTAELVRHPIKAAKKARGKK